MQHLRKIWKDNKHSLMKKIESFDAYTELLKQCPEDMTENSLSTSVNFCTSDEGKVAMFFITICFYVCHYTCNYVVV